MEERIAKLEAISGKLDTQGNQIADLRQYIDLRFTEVNRRFQEQSEQIKELRSEFRIVTRWIIGTQVTIALFMLGLAAKILLQP
ncbi:MULTISPECIES: hypothetical protein [unclassified Duganella]|uniref:hypothetical protein n=1 Tax=unclassified Duganella TaxID=2636909 RepID=UPI000E35430B|nr:MULTISPECIES: hypothetical protein [unclassified Duganella]RFP16371.1 hypothetical protein D0T23_10900 [Duganella sp. BJB475]RFP32468.1 hypothetical protein D0T21_09735 [Duganella sp. BJB476]